MVLPAVIAAMIIATPHIVRFVAVLAVKRGMTYIANNWPKIKKLIDDGKKIAALNTAASDTKTASDRYFAQAKIVNTARLDYERTKTRYDRSIVTYTSASDALSKTTNSRTISQLRKAKKNAKTSMDNLARLTVRKETKLNTEKAKLDNLVINAINAINDLKAKTKKATGT